MAYKNKEDREEYNKNYNIKHRKEISERKKEYYAANRKKILEQQRTRQGEYNETQRIRREEMPWENPYYLAKQRCTNPNNPRFPRYGGRGIEFLLTMDEVVFLFMRDNAEDMDWASIDRVDNDGHYIFENCRFIEMSENNAKRHREKKK